MLYDVAEMRGRKTRAFYGIGHVRVDTRIKTIFLTALYDVVPCNPTRGIITRRDTTARARSLTLKRPAVKIGLRACI